MKKIICILLAAAIMLLSGCTTANKLDSKEIFAMNTVMDFSVYGDDSEQLLKDIINKVNDIDSLLSVTNKNSDIYKINESNGAKTEVSADTAKLISDAKSLCEETGGTLDITVYPIVKAWGFTTEEYNVPDSEEISELLKNVNYSNIEVDSQQSTVTLKENMQIDLGAVAKGYTGKVLADYLKSNGASGILNLGGNVQTVGEKSDGSKWSVGIKDPSGSGAFAALSVGETSVITSGGYQRKFERDSVVYHHIIDPKTGYPANNGILSSTVICSDGLRGDALSTALYVMGTEKAIEYYKANKDFDMVLLGDDNTVYVTEGIKNDFKLSNGYDYSIKYI